MPLPAQPAPGDPEALSGRRLGPYRILDPIGHGGMGDVYRAVRDDDHFQKVVAVKLVRRGMDREFTERFRAERQILARLEHPGIARLIDGGAAEDGRPFLVMEHVEGTRIDEYCRARALDTRARLELFRAVCAAVQYAHRNLVVHRDIKPANILVTAEGVPKLLDFGVAKLLDPTAPDTTVTGVAIITPAYASPEQVSGAPITTSTDVYSLGVVLYELLTGRPLYRLAGASPLEVHRAVCEQEPERPSAAAEAAARFGLGGVAPRSLRGDLDTIVLKALRKEPERRYSSVEQLSEDVRRHLDGRPVLARRDTPGYRLGRFLRRHRLAAASAAALALSLVAGLVGTSWQARVAQQERRKAEAERARAERRFTDLRRLANSLLFELEEAIRDLPGATSARRLVVTRALEYLDSLAREAGADPALQVELAAAYEKVGRVQGYGSGANLGDTAGAFDSYGKALAIRRAVAAARPADPQALTELADTHRHLANLHAKKGDVAAAATGYREAAELAERLARQQPASAAHRMLLARASVGLGRELAAGGDLAAARRAYERALAAAREAAALSPAARTALALAHQGMGDGLQSAGEPERALEHARAALELFAEVAREAPASTSAQREVSLARLNVADALRRLGREREALAQVRQAQAVFERLHAADPSNALAERDVWAALYRLATAPPAAGGAEPAVAAAHRLVGIATRLQERDPASHWARRDLAASRRALAEALSRAGRATESLRTHRLSVESARALAGAAGSARDRAELARALASMGAAQRRAGDAAGAEASLREAAGILEPLGARDPSNADLRAALAEATRPGAATAARRARR